MSRESRIRTTREIGTKAERGFTLVELAVAMFVLIFGLVAVMQLVPAAIRTNQGNRNDSSSTVIAQRLRDLMVTQPIGNTTLDDSTNPSPSRFPCGITAVCNLGGGAANGDFVAGCPLLATGQINFAANPAANYNFTYTDPNDATGAGYDVRWAVITSVRTVGTIANVVVAKRFVIGVRRRGTTAPAVSMFSSWVSR